MHIILRYEIERGLFDGTVSVDDLPRVWNAKMKEYLGVVPPNDKLGVLQDPHWAQGAFGWVTNVCCLILSASPIIRSSIYTYAHSIAIFPRTLWVPSTPTSSSSRR